MKENKDKTMIIKIPAHLAEAIEKFQNKAEVDTYSRPSKNAVILRALAEFFATRITPALLLAMLSGCERSDIGGAVKVLLLFTGCAAIGHILFMIRHGKPNKNN